MFAIGFLVLSTLLTVAFVVYYLRNGVCRVEGFSEEGDKKLTAKQRIEKASAEASNVLLTIIAQAKKASRHVTDPSIWKERIAMAAMSPTELARKHLRSESAKK